MKKICFKDEILFVFVIYHNIYEFHKRVYLYFIDAYYVFILLSCFTIHVYRLSKWLGIKKTISGKNKLASGSRNYFVWISLLFYSWQNHWKNQFLPLFVDKSFFIKMNCQKYGRALAQIEDKSKNKWLRKKYSNIKTGNFI